MFKMRFSMVILAALFMVASVFAADVESDFDARWKEAEANVIVGPGQPYFKDVFFKDTSAKFTAHINECNQTTRETMTSTLKAAIEIGAIGRVLTVLTQPQSKWAECFVELVKKDALPKPPADHFWVPVVLNFSKQ
jgi:hypothetical protein